MYTSISTIVKAYIFACKYADNTPDPVECWHKIEYYQEIERLIYNEMRNNTNTLPSGTPSFKHLTQY